MIKRRQLDDRHCGRFAAVLLGAAMIALGAGPNASAQVSPAASEQTTGIDGLAAPADIFIDAWGVAHIFAASPRDAFFLQGYNAARDRLWQIDLWRKRGLGQLSASFGPAYVDQDRAARLFLYRGDMKQEWAAYAPDARAGVEAWAAGVNAYVAEVLAGAKPLPIEFRLTGSKPETWAPEDVVRIRSHALVANVTSEVARARVACAAGIDADRLRQKVEFGHAPSVPAGLNPCDVPAGVLKDYRLATQSVEFDALKGAMRADREPDVQLAEAIDLARAEGSNNWTIAPSRTATGRPILANDPHRTLGAPSLRYVVGLHAPGLDLVGAGEPALPGVSLGHNADIAFGITIFGMDQEDLYVYETKPGDPTRYRYRGKWEKMTTVNERIAVKGEASPREVALHFTRHGPVLAEDGGKQRAFAMRTVWSESGLSGYFGSSRLWTAKSWDEFMGASGAWGAPPLNLVYADINGNIGWAAAGRTPIRTNWDGLMPVPGDGRYEWAGFRPAGTLPSVRNPKAGFVATANEMNLPAAYPADKRPAYEWTDPSRATRLKEVLAETSKSTLGDSMALQVDVVSPQARRLTALLRGMASRDADVSKALQLLNAWNCEERVDSAATALYEIWATRHLGKTLIARVTPEAARPLLGNGHLEAVLSYLEAPGPELGADKRKGVEAVFADSLKSAMADTTQRLGEDTASWSWGRLHQAVFEPAAAAVAGRELKQQMTVGPLQTPGSSSTPRAQSYDANFKVVAGASVRLVMDVGAWDNSVMMNSPGQSGDPYSAHYRDLFPAWAEGTYVPLRFSRAAVERDARVHMHLSPKATSTAAGSVVASAPAE